MIMPWPTAEEERADAMRDAARGWAREGFITAEDRQSIDNLFASSWRSSSRLAAVVFFFLTLLAMGGVFGLFALGGSAAGAGFVTGLGFLAAAELLIRVQRLAGYGIESALWIGGLFALLATLPHTGDPEALLICAAACALAGWRVRNAYFGTIAIALVIIYLAVKLERPQLFWQSTASDVAVVVTCLAGAALLRRWQRPSTERLFAVTVVVMPALAYVLGTWYTSDDIVVTAEFALLAAVSAIVGLATRQRPLLLSAAVSTIVVGITVEIQNWSEWELMTAGALFVAVAVVVSRLLRTKTTGITATKAVATPYDTAMLVGGTLVATSQTASADAATSAPAPQTGGGEFGGAGASGSF